MLDRLLTVLRARFGTAPALTEAPRGVDVLADMANRRVIRRYTDRPVDPALLDTLCAVALSAPSKSDLQQGDIVIVSDAGQREKLEALLPDNPWVKAAPVFLVFCGNNRRHRLLFEWRKDQPWRERAIRIASAALIGGGTGAAVVLVFTRLFLVRLP